MTAVPSISGFLPKPAPQAHYLPTGTPFDQHFQGVPRSAITEIAGPPSSGRTALTMSILAKATANGETCAIVDTSDNFDPASAALCQVNLDSVLWIRCGGHAGNAMRIADILVQSGGFGLVCLDLADVPARTLNRIPNSYWHRFRLALEKQLTVMLVISAQPNVRSCAARSIECSQEGIQWSGQGNARLLRGVKTAAALRKPVSHPVPIYAVAS